VSLVERIERIETVLGLDADEQPSPVPVIGLQPQGSRIIDGFAIRTIARHVGREVGLTLADLLSQRRTMALFLPRCAVAWIAYNNLSRTAVQIGRSMQRDRSTICNQLSRAEDLLRTDPVFRMLVVRVTRRLFQETEQ